MLRNHGTNYYLIAITYQFKIPSFNAGLWINMKLLHNMLTLFCMFENLLNPIYLIRFLTAADH